MLDSRDPGVGGLHRYRFGAAFSRRDEHARRRDLELLRDRMRQDALRRARLHDVVTHRGEGAGSGEPTSASNRNSRACGTDAAALADVGVDVGDSPAKRSPSERCAPPVFAAADLLQRLSLQPLDAD